MKEYIEQMQPFYNQATNNIDYKKYYDMRSKLFKKLEGTGNLKSKILIIRALFNKNTKIIPTELEREDYGADVGYIVSIRNKTNY